jgi:hypothetical protein
MKSEKLLSKFWADGLDSDHASDEEVYSLLLRQEGRRRII